MPKPHKHPHTAWLLPQTAYLQDYQAHFATHDEDEADLDHILESAAKLFEQNIRAER